MDPWQTRYDRARAKMLEGRFREAESDFRALSSEAKGAERTLAEEMANLARSYAERVERTLPDPPPSAFRKGRPRSTDELTLLYTSAFLYGAGTGIWFLLQTQPDSTVTAVLPFAAITAAPVIAVATIDGYKTLPHGLPHAITAGLYLGLGEGIFAVGLQAARAKRFEAEDPNSDARFSPETVATILWGGATLGAALGTALGTGIVTTPGRVSFVASTAIWSGTLTGFATGAILADNDKRQERAFAVGGIGYNAGLAGGLLFAGELSPTVARVRLVDLSGIAGGLCAAGLYVGVTSDPDIRLAEGLTALGASAGLGLGWLLTSSMLKETPSDQRSPTVVPTLAPVQGGLTIGLGGAL